MEHIYRYIHLDDEGSQSLRYHIVKVGTTVKTKEYKLRGKETHRI